MTDNEKEFFERLIEALPYFYVFPQVAMGAILQPALRQRGGIRAILPRPERRGLPRIWSRW